jgi:hypothetical protein
VHTRHARIAPVHVNVPPEALRTGRQRAGAPAVNVPPPDLGDEVEVTASMRPGISLLSRSDLNAKRYFLDAQLDSLQGGTFLDNLTFLPGLSSRLHGGALPPSLHAGQSTCATFCLACGPKHLRHLLPDTRASGSHAGDLRDTRATSACMSASQ